MTTNHAASPVPAGRVDNEGDVMADLIVSEVFGPTWQGEGPSTGQRAAFVRLGLCNLDCRWCDTAYTWDWTGKNGPPQDRTKLAHRSAEDVTAEVVGLMRGPGLVVITGGEPLVQRRSLVGLVEELQRAGYRVEIETNGTIAPHSALSSLRPAWNVSPKLAHSGVSHNVAIKRQVLGFLCDLGAAFKFVCGTRADLAEVDAIRCTVGIPPDRVWIMPEGRDAAKVIDGMRDLADAALCRGYNLTSRLHVLVWGDERGR